MDAAPITSQVSKPTPSKPASGSGATGRTLRPLSGLTLFSVGALVLSVSLSLIGDVAAQENERDARETLTVLHTTLCELEAIDAPTLHRLRDLSTGPWSRLGDRVWVDSRTVARHGYLFRAAAANPNGLRCLAWPAQRGRTGRTVHAIDREGRLWQHPGGEGWSGIGATPDAADGGWRLTPE